jgi:hypothetical protein
MAIPGYSHGLERELGVEESVLFSIIVAGHGADGMARSILISPLLARRGNRKMPFEEGYG